MTTNIKDFWERAAEAYLACERETERLMVEEDLTYEEAHDIVNEMLGLSWRMADLSQTHELSEIEEEWLELEEADANEKDYTWCGVWGRDEY